MGARFSSLPTVLVEQAIVGRDENGAPLKMPAWEASLKGIEFTK